MLEGSNGNGTMDVYWLEQTEADVPAERDWLGTQAVTYLSGLRFAKRRADWRLGRWTAKRALAIWLGMPSHPEVLAQIEIRPAPSGAPEVFVANKLQAVSVSLTHRAGRAACAVAPSGVELGCDLEMIEPHSDAFISDYFTHKEQALVTQAHGADRLRLLALMWSAKESALKALHEGLRRDTRSVAVIPFERAFDRKGWSPLRVRDTDGRVFLGWWQQADSIVRTLVAAPPPNPPIQLRIPDYVPHAAALGA
jgi:4'-phosphopantetheinyl transferase